SGPPGSPPGAAPGTRSTRPQLTHPHGAEAFRIPVPDVPTDIAVAPSGAVYVTRAYAAAVARVDVDRRSMTTSIDVGSNPTRLVIGPRGSAFVTNQFGGSVSVIDLAHHIRIADIAVHGDPAPLAIAPDGSTLFVATNHDVLYAA